MKFHRRKKNQLWISRDKHFAEFWDQWSSGSTLCRKKGWGFSLYCFKLRNLLFCYLGFTYLGKGITFDHPVSKFTQVWNIKQEIIQNNKIRKQTLNSETIYTHTPPTKIQSLSCTYIFVYICVYIYIHICKTIIKEKATINLRIGSV